MSPPRKQEPEPGELPNTLTALVWVTLAKYGLGAVGFMLLVPVYMDFKESNREQMTMLRANIEASGATAKAMDRLSDRIDESHNKVESMGNTVSIINESLKRIESKVSQQ
jgi:hypothetical protein